VSHEISLAIWDVPSPFVIGRRATIKVGISCPSGCVLAGTTIEIRDQQGALLGSGVIGSEPWPGSIALYWVEIDVAAPDVEGAHTWTVHGIPIDPAHDALNGSVRVIAAGPPEHRLTIEVIEQGSGVPLGDVELRVGAFRATTNKAGRAHVDVPGGTYDVHAWKLGYDLLSSTASVAADTTMQLEVALTRQTEQPYWM
jgi:hypothetical protein